MNAASVLCDALSIIAAPNRWTQEATARDYLGNECKPADQRAKRFDMIGAIQRVEADPNDYGTAIRILRAQCGKQSIFDFNDCHGHKAIVRCMKRAIRAAETLQ